MLGQVFVMYVSGLWSIPRTNQFKKSYSQIKDGYGESVFILLLIGLLCLLLSFADSDVIYSYLVNSFGMFCKNV